MFQRLEDGSMWVKGINFWHYVYKDFGLCVEIFTEPERSLSNFVLRIAENSECIPVVLPNIANNATMEVIEFYITALQEAKAVCGEWESYRALLNDA